MNIFLKLILLICGLLIHTSCNAQINRDIVSEYGQLNFRKTHLINESGESVQLRGMSLFWSQWQPQFYNEITIKQLKEDWGITVIRAAMAVENGGYLKNPELEREKIYKVVEAAIKYNIYVIVDWHDHHAEDHIEESKAFFSELSMKYGQYPNLIYETYNEPLEVSWSEVLKPYHLEIIAAIRKNDPDNLIICGTPSWSQNVKEASLDPINKFNIGYTLHFYSGTHGAELRKKAEAAIKNGLPIFVTEFGTTDADGDGKVYYKQTHEWMNFLNDNNLSWCNWSIADKDEASAALKAGTKPINLNNVSKSGALIKELLKKSRH